MFLTRLSIGIQTNGKMEQEELDELRKISTNEKFNSEDTYNNGDQILMQEHIIKIIKEKEVLIILDN